MLQKEWTHGTIKYVLKAQENTRKKKKEYNIYLILWFVGWPQGLTPILQNVGTGKAKWRNTVPSLCLNNIKSS